MNKNTCSTCVHYSQHYTFYNERIFRVYCGHCTFPKLKKRCPDSQACGNYTATSPDEAAFVKKEYLSKRLLEYMLNLELLPNIENLEQQVKE